MEELENCKKESMLMSMLIKTTVDSIIQNEVIHLSNQINAYRKSISLNILNLPNDKLASLANLENLAEAMQGGWKSRKSNSKNPGARIICHLQDNHGSCQQLRKAGQDT